MKINWVRFRKGGIYHAIKKIYYNPNLNIITFCDRNWNKRLFSKTHTPKPWQKRCIKCMNKIACGVT